MRRVNLLVISYFNKKLYKYKTKLSQYLVYECNNPPTVLGLRKDQKYIIVLRKIRININNAITN